MCDEQKDAAYYLRKIEEYREKSRAVSEPRLKAALEAVARSTWNGARARPFTLLKRRELSPFRVIHRRHRRKTE